jgi:hypothetical protein
MKICIQKLFLISALLMVAGPVYAQSGGPNWADKSGGFGVGAETTLGDTSGLNLRYYINELFGTGLTFGFGFDTHNDINESGNMSDYTSTDLSVGLTMLYKVAYWNQGHLSALLGFDIHTRNELEEREDENDIENSANDVLLSLGLHGEWFPTQYFSIFGQAGLRLDFLGENELENGVITTIPGEEDDNEYSGFSMDMDGDLLGAFGFTVWFN